MRNPIPTTDTICAPATAPGEGAIGIVRISGPEAIRTADAVFAASSGQPLHDAPSHTVHHGRVQDGTGAPLDEVLVVLMRGPRSYTTEDVVEIQCHGGGAAVEVVLEALLANGCRLAAPGEFTRRAFENGRIDLTRAEAVLEVIQAATATAHRLAERQLGGALAVRMGEIAEQVKTELARLEAAIDFPDDDPDELEVEASAAGLPRAASAIADLLARGRTGHLLREGVRLAIVGRPNVGKSSLLNRLAGEERAIVAASAGTTRDVVETAMAVDGVRFLLQDTAGIRNTGDQVEAEGVKRSRKTLSGADVVLAVVDGSSPLTDDDVAVLEQLPQGRGVIAVNKSDLPERPPLSVPNGYPAVAVSALTGDGIDALTRALVACAAGPGAVPLEAAFLLNLRQRDALNRAKKAADRAVAGQTAGAFPELVATDLREALDALGEVTGETTTDDLLDTIFERFCIGK